MFMKNIFAFVEDGNEDFDRFISLLGDRVSLQGWDKFKAGLDVKCKFVTCPLSLSSIFSAVLYLFIIGLKRNLLC